MPEVVEVQTQPLPSNKTETSGEVNGEERETDMETTTSGELIGEINPVLNPMEEVHQEEEEDLGQVPLEMDLMHMDMEPMVLSPRVLTRRNKRNGEETGEREEDGERWKHGERTGQREIKLKLELTDFLKEEDTHNPSQEREDLSKEIEEIKELVADLFIEEPTIAREMIGDGMLEKREEKHGGRSGPKRTRVREEFNQKHGVTLISKMRLIEREVQEEEQEDLMEIDRKLSSRKKEITGQIISKRKIPSIIIMASTTTMEK